MKRSIFGLAILGAAILASSGCRKGISESDFFCECAKAYEANPQDDSAVRLEEDGMQMSDDPTRMNEFRERVMKKCSEHKATLDLFFPVD